MPVKFANNAVSTLASGINDSVTSITVASGDGALFPSLTGSEYFFVTLIDASNNLEIAKCTARSSDVLTVTRAQESTSARAFAVGDRIELRITAQSLLDVSTQISALGSDLGLNSNDITGTGNINITGTIQSSGNITAPSFGGALDLNGAELILDADADTSITADTDDQIDFKTGGTDRMSITTTDITTASGVNVKMHGSGSSGTQAGLWIRGVPRVTNDTSTFEHTYINSDNALIFTKGSSATTSSNTERMRINSSGEILFNKNTNNFGTAGICFNDLGTKAGAAEFIADGMEPIVINRLSSDGIVVVFHKDGASGGSISTSASSTTYATSSDYRLKENVDYTFDATTRLKQLKPARFNFIVDADKTVDGFIAHEVSSIVPEAIIGTKDATRTATNVVKNADGTFNSEGVTEAEWTKDKADGNYANDTTWSASMSDIPVMQQIDQAKLVPLLVKTIQELEARITALEG